MKFRIITTFLLITAAALLFFSSTRGENKLMTKQFNKLTPEEERVLIHKGTELPNTGELLHNKLKGIYTCRRCDAKLYLSESKFESGCGWPSFDDEIDGAVKKIPDADGRRTEIVCNNCGGHLGHVFSGEGFTEKNTRHCVNSISMKFSPDEQNNAEKAGVQKAFFAGGCFWGVEYLLSKIDGVISVESGYTGGNVESPTYRQVCSGTTGHLEAVKVEFYPSKVKFEELAKAFFEIHDFSQQDGQGPDIGPQYLSAIFYTDEKQKEAAENIIGELKNKGLKVATRLIAFTTFWPAEEPHQDYYQKNGKLPYCHMRRKIF